jgi:hypothetical protein
MQTPAKESRPSSAKATLSPSDVFASALDSPWLSAIVVLTVLAVAARLFYVF